jgi:hypothetical protein
MPPVSPTILIRPSQQNGAATPKAADQEIAFTWGKRGKMTQGRHCIGRPGLGRRDITMILAAADGAEGRPRHRRERSARRSTTEAAGVLVAAAVLAMLAVSGWYAATGATAVAQMLAR